jgi:hypothetical protein
MHIDTRFHLIKEYEANGQIHMEFTRTDEQLGDVLTKSLSRVKFQELCSKIEFISVFRLELGFKT